MAGFRGIFPAIVTPMAGDGEFNEDAFRRIMEYDIQAGVHGFWVAGGTGESVLLSDDENMRIAAVAADQNGGRVANIMHVGAPTTARAARLAEHAAKVGVEAICCVPPFFYQRSDEAIVEHYRVVAAAADLPLFIYNLPQATGVEVTTDMMKKIQDGVPQLAGLKHSALNFQNIAAFARMELSCFTGNANLLLPALTIGGAGVIDGPICAAPEYWIDIWNAYKDGDLRRAEAAQERTGEVMGIVTKFEFFASIKALVSERLGVDCGDPRPPALPLTAEERAYVREEVARLWPSEVAASG